MQTTCHFLWEHNKWQHQSKWHVVSGKQYKMQTTCRFLWELKKRQHKPLEEKVGELTLIKILEGKVGKHTLGEFGGEGW